MLFCSSALHAENFLDNTILGVAFISQNVDTEISGTGVTTSESGSGLGIYLDKYYKRKYRFNGTLSYITYDDFDITQLMVSADYLMPVNSSISFFGGGSIGGAIQTYSDASLSDSAIGLVYGVQLGAIGYISKNLMLEAGYRLRPTNIETDIVTSPGTTATVDDLSETYISILLMF